MYTQEMPKIDLEYLKTQLLPADLELVRGIVSTQGKNAGRLRASKPKVTMLYVGKNQYGHDDYEPDEHEGKTASQLKDGYLAAFRQVREIWSQFPSEVPMPPEARAMIERGIEMLLATEGTENTEKGTAQ